MLTVIVAGLTHFDASLLRMPKGAFRLDWTFALGLGAAMRIAVTVPSQFYLGSALVDTKTNEIPVARELFAELDLAGRRVALDALHTQAQTARDLVLEHGADYLLTVKGNQPTLRQNIARLVPVPAMGFSSSGPHAHPGTDGGKEQPRQSHALCDTQTSMPLKTPHAYALQAQLPLTLPLFNY